MRYIINCLLFIFPGFFCILKWVEASQECASTRCIANCYFSHIGIVVLPNDIQQELDTELLPEELPVVLDDRGEILDVPDLDMELGFGPDPEVEEQMHVDFEQELLVFGDMGQLDKKLRRHQDVDVDEFGPGFEEEGADDCHAPATHQLLGVDCVVGDKVLDQG